jgi:hypothetical protein
MLDHVGEIASDQNLPGISFLSDDAELPVWTAQGNCDTLKREWSVIIEFPSYELLLGRAFTNDGGTILCHCR